MVRYVDTCMACGMPFRIINSNASASAAYRASPRLNLTHGERLLEFGGKLVGLLDLDELAGGDHVPEDLEEGAVGPGLALVVRLDVGLDRGTGGSGAVLELADGGDDSCRVHG